MPERYVELLTVLTPLQAPVGFNHYDKTPEENDLREKKWLMISVYGGRQGIAE